MLTAKITKTDKDVIRKTQEPFMEISVSFYDGTKVVAKRKYGYPLSTSAKEIKADIKKMAKTLTHELAHAEKEKEAEATRTQADKVLEDLKGVEIK